MSDFCSFTRKSRISILSGGSPAAKAGVRPFPKGTVEAGYGLRLPPASHMTAIGHVAVDHDEAGLEGENVEILGDPFRPEYREQLAVLAFALRPERSEIFPVHPAGLFERQVDAVAGDEEREQGSADLLVEHAGFHDALADRLAFEDVLEFESGVGKESFHIAFGFAGAQDLDESLSVLGRFRIALVVEISSLQGTVPSILVGSVFGFGRLLGVHEFREAAPVIEEERDLHRLRGVLGADLPLFAGRLRFHEVEAGTVDFPGERCGSGCVHRASFRDFESVWAQSLPSWLSAAD